jgi:hypothetical protein
MAGEKDQDKQIRVSAGTYKLLTKMADQQGVSYKELVHLMATYFQVTKANPADPQGDLPGLGIEKLTQKVDALDKRFIGFVREQEKALLKPILSEVQATRQQVASGLSPQDLQRLGERLQGTLFMLFGRALEADHLTEAYIEEFNRKATQR